jgi:hypothetical protein
LTRLNDHESCAISPASKSSEDEDEDEDEDEAEAETLMDPVYVYATLIHPSGSAATPAGNCTNRLAAAAGAKESRRVPTEPLRKTGNRFPRRGKETMAAETMEEEPALTTPDQAGRVAVEPATQRAVTGVLAMGGLSTAVTTICTVEGGADVKPVMQSIAAYWNEVSGADEGDETTSRGGR